MRELVGGVLAGAEARRRRRRSASYHARRRGSHSSKCCAAASGCTKNCISICSNSRIRKTKLPGLISLRNALPTCAIPNGTFFRLVSFTFRKFT